MNICKCDPMTRQIADCENQQKRWQPLSPPKVYGNGWRFYAR